ncbi:MAG: lysylphosphatidylglycerol synthase domain-containing protein, partial [Acidimicrobiales bacterium]
MNIARSLRKHLSLPAIGAIGAGFGVLTLVMLVHTVDGADLGRTLGRASDDPFGVAVALAAFGAAFAIRAAAWRRVLPGLSFAHALAGIHLSLGANHVLPFRLGEPLRVLSVVKRQKVDLETATASTVALRAVDILTVVAIGLLVAPGAYGSLLGPTGWLVIAAVVVLAVAGWRWLGSLARRRGDISLPGPVALGLSAAAWLAESVLVWYSARWAGLDASWADAVLVTTVAVAAQVAAIAPGGFGTYEVASVAAYVALGYHPEAALIAALTAHALKTSYSLVVGAIAAFVPSPGFVGRLRLTSRLPTRSPGDIDPASPVVLFMPAHDEEATVGRCVRRAPGSVRGHPVQVIVIDDGSTDATAERARSAGAEVVSLPENRGLGAAVRVGLAIAVEREAAVIAFCDADGEYPLEELATVVEPVLAGRADYVVGSRFLGRIDRMHPHRRLGNVVLSRVLSLIARRRITDGQSGYRAFSLEAASSAEIIHDFNYAQVLTLDLLAKGYPYLEVPISYHFRTAGRSFIRPGS